MTATMDLQQHHDQLKLLLSIMALIDSEIKQLVCMQTSLRVGADRLATVKVSTSQWWKKDPQVMYKICVIIIGIKLD